MSHGNLGDEHTIRHLGKNVNLYFKEKSPDPCESGDVWGMVMTMVLLDG